MPLNEERQERYIPAGYEPIKMVDHLNCTAVVICDNQECEADLHAITTEGGGQEFIDCGLDILTGPATEGGMAYLRIRISKLWCPLCRKAERERAEAEAEARRGQNRPV